VERTPDYGQAIAGSSANFEGAIMPNGLPYEDWLKSQEGRTGNL
jgi:hypothetical protein